MWVHVFSDDRPIALYDVSHLLLFEGKYKSIIALVRRLEQLKRSRSPTWMATLLLLCRYFGANRLDSKKIDRKSKKSCKAYSLTNKPIH